MLVEDYLSEMFYCAVWLWALSICRFGMKDANFGQVCNSSSPITVLYLEGNSRSLHAHTDARVPTYIYPFSGFFLASFCRLYLSGHKSSTWVSTLPGLGLGLHIPTDNNKVSYASYTNTMHASTHTHTEWVSGNSSELCGCFFLLWCLYAECQWCECTQPGRRPLCNIG